MVVILDLQTASEAPIAHEDSRLHTSLLLQMCKEPDFDFVELRTETTIISVNIQELLGAVLMLSAHNPRAQSVKAGLVICS